MDCVRCGLRAGYNRVVVDLISGSELGGFCRNCELEAFGHALSKFDGADESCVLCTRDGHYAVPAWQPYEKKTDSHVACAVEFSVHDRTPTLCDEHFHELCTDEDRPAVPQRGFNR